MAGQVTVVGLGPAGPDLLTDATRRLLTGPRPVFLRTRHHPAAEAVPDAVSFDHHYDEGVDFDDVYRRIVEDLIGAASHGGPVVYAVPGSPLVAERTVELLLADPRAEVTILPAMSFLDLAWAGLAVDPLAAGVRLVDGTRFAEQAAGERGPLLVAQCWSTEVLSEVKLALDAEPGAEEPEVTVLHHLGLPDERITTVAWQDLDRAPAPDHLTSLWIPALAAPVARELVALDELTRRLRRDCPWDREQTHASLARHLIEEAYETTDAIDELVAAQAVGDGAAEALAVGHLEEELGDVLFQVYIHSVLAAEEGRFTVADVARGVHDKLVARHPHVFGDTVAKSAGAVESNWEALKKAEKGRDSVTEGIPTALPALALAAKLQAKGDHVPGAVGPQVRDMSDTAVWPDLVRTSGRSPSAEELGEWLWNAVAFCRAAGIDPEGALRDRSRRYMNELRAIEEHQRNGHEMP